MRCCSTPREWGDTSLYLEVQNKVAVGLQVVVGRVGGLFFLLLAKPLGLLLFDPLLDLIAAATITEKEM
jgi:hypothetical protein